MAINGGYNILDLTSHGRISVPGEVVISAEEMKKFIDPQKPTFVVVKTHMTTADIDSDISGFGIKTLNEGVAAITVHHVAFTRNGNKLVTSAIS